jgi:hypothetical protein
MKLRCNDGVVRRFEISRMAPDYVWRQWLEAQCLDCGHLFGVHDTKILKPRFKEHSCVIPVHAIIMPKK